MNIKACAFMNLLLIAFLPSIFAENVQFRGVQKEKTRIIKMGDITVEHASPKGRSDTYTVEADQTLIFAGAGTINRGPGNVIFTIKGVWSLVTKHYPPEKGKKRKRKAKRRLRHRRWLGRISVSLFFK